MKFLRVYRESIKKMPHFLGTKSYLDSDYFAGNI